MSVTLGTLPITSGKNTAFIAPSNGLKAILIGNDSGLTVTVTMENCGVQKTLYPGVLDWFAVRRGFNGVIRVSPYTVLNNVAAWPASSLIFDAIGLNDPEHADMYPVAMYRVINSGNVVAPVVVTNPLTLYGSNVLDATLVNAGDMSTATGGAEANSAITSSGSNEWLELAAKTATLATVASIPATPTGNGWIWFPGFALTFVAANWNAFVQYNQGVGFSSVGKLTLRFFKLPAGVLANKILMGTIALTGQKLEQTKDLYTFPATSIAKTSFADVDGLYTDLWGSQATGGNWTGAGPANIYESNSKTAGVANDMQIVTGGYTTP